MKERLHSGHLGRRGPAASAGGTAACRGPSRPQALAGALALAATLALGGIPGCAFAPEETGAPGPEGAAAGFRVLTAPSPSERERYCAWYGDRSGDVLYYGQAPFWWAMRRSGGDPEADARVPGPLRLGRFDLVEERHLPPLDLPVPPDPSGVWDVLARPDGRLFFTTFFGAAGWLGPGGARMERLPDAGPWLGELAPGPEGGVLVARYAAADGQGSGSLVLLSAEGELQREWVLPASEGIRLGPKTPAWDPAREELWVTTDRLDARGRRLPPAADEPRGAAHPTLVLGRDGEVRRRIEEREVQFVRFDGEGLGRLAVAEGPEGGSLALLTISPDAARSDLDAARRTLLDPAFPAGLDFAQDLQPTPRGGVVVTRWSGRVHVVPAGGGEARSVRFPAVGERGLYYTAVLARDRICATHCGDVQVVCGPAPGAMR